MLGRLAKRLRLLGYDVLYDVELDDNGIIRLSLEQQRVILTRDTALTRRPLASNHLFIKDQKVEAQLEQVLSAFPPDPDTWELTRCSRCNGRLSPLPRPAAKDLVPEHVYQRHGSFWKCEGCGRAYWTGTHVGHMRLKRRGRL